ncbi:MAG TPA: hypothetical protein VGF34_11210 [Stellaceae bacterium]
MQRLQGIGIGFAHEMPPDRKYNLDMIHDTFFSNGDIGVAIPMRLGYEGRRATATAALLSAARVAKEFPIVAAVVFRSWFDDSERDDQSHNVSALAGCVGSDEQWETFNRLWKLNVLDKFNLEYLHMKELRSAQGQFAKFQDRNISIELTKEIVTAISTASLRSFASIVRLRDLIRFNRVQRQQLNPYSLNIYTCMLYITMTYRDWNNCIVKMKLDRIGDLKPK